MRAIGPSLGVNGVAGALSDPVLELHNESTLLQTNDNWRDSQEQEIIDSTIPPTDNLESSIVATLDPGPYTAIVSGKNNGTGIGLVEVYDLDQAANSQLANISTRGFVDINDNAMTSGTVSESCTFCQPQPSISCIVVPVYSNQRRLYQKMWPSGRAIQASCGMLSAK